MKENDGKNEEKEKIWGLLYFSKNLFSVNFISRKTKRLTTMKKMLIPLVGLAMGFALFAACSNDSDSANSLVSGSFDSTVAKVESASFALENGSCNPEGITLRKTEAKADSAHLYVNEDGSAVFKERMRTICRWDGKITNISLDKQEDTLFVSIEYYEYPQDTLIYLSDSTVHVVGHGEFKCGACSVDYEIDIPAKFASAKYANINLNGRVLFYPIAYVKE